jgi:hypothetical protein
VKKEATMCCGKDPKKDAKKDKKAKGQNPCCGTPAPAPAPKPEEKK